MSLNNIPFALVHVADVVETLGPYELRGERWRRVDSMDRILDAPTERIVFIDVHNEPLRPDEIKKRLAATLSERRSLRADEVLHVRQVNFVQRLEYHVLEKPVPAGFEPLEGPSLLICSAVAEAKTGKPVPFVPLHRLPNSVATPGGRVRAKDYLTANGIYIRHSRKADNPHSLVYNPEAVERRAAAAVEKKEILSKLKRDFAHYNVTRANFAMAKLLEQFWPGMRQFTCRSDAVYDVFCDLAELMDYVYGEDAFLRLKEVQFLVKDWRKKSVRIKEIVRQSLRPLSATRSSGVNRERRAHNRKQAEKWFRLMNRAAKLQLPQVKDRHGVWTPVIKRPRVLTKYYAS